PSPLPVSFSSTPRRRGLRSRKCGCGKPKTHTRRTGWCKEYPTMLTHDEVFKLFQEAEAVLSGHFLLSSGLHSDTYLQRAPLLQFPRTADTRCPALADHFLTDDRIPEVVLAPALGGILVAYAVAQALARAGNDRRIRNLFAEREEGVLRLRRGFEIRP